MFSTLKSCMITVLATGLMCLANALPANAQNNFYMTMPDVTANGGVTVTVPVSLTNAEGIFSMQIEVFLPDGIDIVGIERTERTIDATSCDIAANDQYTADNQRYRRILINNLYPTDGSAIEAGEGEIFKITFQLPEGEAIYPIQLKNIQFFNPPTYALNYIEDVTANITAADYYFTFPDDIQANCGEDFIVPLNLHNAGGIYSIQIDLMMPDGIEFVDATLGERVNAEFFNYGSEDKYTDDGQRYRRVIFANLISTNSTLTGNEGTVVNYKLRVLPSHTQNVYTLRVSNLQYFNPPTYQINYIDDAEGIVTVDQTSLIGDVNHDGNVNITDVTILIGMVLNDNLEAGCEICSDVNPDGKINITDVTLLIDIVLNSAK